MSSDGKDLGHDDLGHNRALTKSGMGIVEGLPLEASAGGIEELRKDIQRLMDIEAIKQLKHAYFRCIDTANFEELATLFHEDITVDFLGGTYNWKLKGKEEYVNSLKASFHNESVGQHNGHMPEIQILSATEATGIWYLEDHMWIFNHSNFTKGTALYWDSYSKVDGRWLITATNYQRIYEINEEVKERPNLGAHYLAIHGGDPV